MSSTRLALLDIGSLAMSSISISLGLALLHLAYMSHRQMMMAIKLIKPKAAMTMTQKLVVCLSSSATSNFSSSS